MQRFFFVVDQRFDFITIAGKLVDSAFTTISFCTLILFVFVGPASGIRAMIGRAFCTHFRRALNMFPAWNQRLDAADSLNGNLVLIDCGADAFKSLDVGFRKEALISLSFCDENKPSPFIEADGFD